MDIQDIVTSTLEDLKIPIIYGWYDKELDSTHITFLEIEEMDTEFLNDVNTCTEHLVQVDIWTKDGIEAQNFKKIVKEKMKKVDNIRFSDGADSFENDTKLWHISQRFYITEFIEG